MLTHQELIAAILTRYPQLIHGQDFWVGQEMNGDVHVAPARIYQWGIPEKYLEVVRPAQDFPAIIDEENPEKSREAYTMPAVTEERTRFLSSVPQPTDEDLTQMVADNAAAYALAAAENAARFKRNDLLIEADTMLLIAEDTGQPTDAIRQYRQLLRDVPQQAGFPHAIDWPVPPAPAP